MPVLRIMSIYCENKRKYASDLARAREELEQFKAALLARFGVKTADSVCQRLQWTEAMVFGRVEVLPLPHEAEGAVKTLRKVSRKVTAVLKKIRSPDCYSHEPTTPIPVLETMGLSWSEVQERCSDDGRLSVSGVLWLLNAVRMSKQVFPSEEQMYGRIAEMHGDARLPVEWRLLLKRRGLRLRRLLTRAAQLEEEVRYGQER